MNTLEEVIRSVIRPAAVFLSLVLFLSPALSAEPVDTDDYQSRLSLAVEAPTDRITIDGHLDPSEWCRAAVADNFVERSPGDNATPQVATTALVTYNSEFLYVGFVCHEDPATIRATMCQRDRFHNNDEVALLLDTYGEAAWAYEFFVNPHGIQKDYLWSTINGEDSGFDLVWHAAAQITDSGYQVEMAIPFTSLRFPSTEMQEWRIDFRRMRPRESFYHYSWSPHDRNDRCGPCQWGTLRGITNVQPGQGLEILPTYVACQSGGLSRPNDASASFDNDDLIGDLSLGAKYAISSDMTLEATYNPDFSQIEADAAQVDVNSTIALYYPERRPFFQEGADIFRTLFNSFHTRTVNDPEYAVKLISRRSGYTLGFMSAQDQNTAYTVPLEEGSSVFLAGKSYVNVLRATKSIGEASQAGFILTDKRLDGGGYGTIAAVDGDIRLSRTLGIDGQFIASFTGEPDKAGASGGLAGVAIDEGRRTAIFDGESFQGNAVIGRFHRFARDWSFLVSYTQVEPSYRTETGYDPWVNYRDGNFETWYRIYPQNSVVQRIEPRLRLENRWRFDGLRRWQHQRASLDVWFNWMQSHVSGWLRHGEETWTSNVSGSMVEYESMYGGGLHACARLSDAFGFGINADRSDRVARFAEATGLQNDINVNLTLKPIDRLVIEPGLQFVSNHHKETDMELFRQVISHTRVSLQVNRELSLRLVLQYDDSRAALYRGEVDGSPQYYHWSDRSWHIDPLITYQVSSFSVLHAGSTHQYNYLPLSESPGETWKLSSRQFFIKLQYLFQV